MLHQAPATRAVDPALLFQFDFEMDSMEKSKVDGRDGRFIGGYISTDHMDRAGETLVQEGLCFNHFLSKGWFNDNHDTAGDSLVGYPTMVRLDELEKGHKGWYVEGELLPEGANPRADSLWNIAQGLHKAGGQRKLGFSVEGSIDDRDPRNPKRVRKARVREVAITRCPVNTKTGLDVLAKSLAVGTPAGEPGSAVALEPEALEGVTKKKLRKGQAVELLLSIKPQIGRARATAIVEYAQRHYPA